MRFATLWRAKKGGFVACGGPLRTSHEDDGFVKAGLALALSHPLDPFEPEAEMVEDGRQDFLARQRLVVELAVADDVSQPRPEAQTSAIWPA